jgi:hypothetical protein
MFKGEHTMATTKTTRAQLFARIAETMANDSEVVEMCEKYIAQLSKPRPHKANPKVAEFAELLYNHMVAEDEELTASEWAGFLSDQVGETVSTQKVSAALSRLVKEGLVDRIVGETKSSKPLFAAFVEEN